MTWQEFLQSELTLEEYMSAHVQEVLGAQVNRAVERLQAETDALERRIAECEFDRLVRQNAVLGGVLPRAVEHIAASARELFEIRDSALVVRDGQTDPGDPLTPLSFQTWLNELRQEKSFLFTKES